MGLCCTVTVLMHPVIYQSPAQRAHLLHHKAVVQRAPTQQPGRTPHPWEAHEHHAGGAEMRVGGKLATGVLPAHTLPSSCH